MTPLNNNWVIWYHDNNNDWTINGYKKIYEITTIEDFWEIYLRLNNYILLKGQFFLMKKGIEPIWENEENVKGGCWSYKINKNDSFMSWLYLSINICGEIITKDHKNIDSINGISLSPKKNFCIIKIWNNDRTNIENILVDKINNINLSLCLYKNNKERN
jgi:hypothetical protein|tara:strand:+ start:1466 stop:1945 length:480 start_codon:yes stop_codon:yes gene_type:complete